MAIGSQGEEGASGQGHLIDKSKEAGMRLADTVCKSFIEGNVCEAGASAKSSLAFLEGGTNYLLASLPAAPTMTAQPKSDNTWLLLLALGVALAVLMMKAKE